MAVTSATSATRINPQQQVDSTPEIDTEAAPLQNTEAAQTELRGWLAKRGTQRPSPDGPAGSQTPAAVTAAPPPLQTLTTLRESLDKLERKLQGVPQSMRDALAKGFEASQPPDASLKPYADLATQTAATVAAQLSALPEADRKNVLQLLDMGRWFPMSQTLMGSMPVPSEARAPPATPAPAQLTGALGQALSSMGAVDNPNKLEALLQAAAKDGISADQLVNQLISGKGAVAQALLPRLNIPQLQNLTMHLDTNPKNAKQYMARFDGIMKLATQMAGSGPSTGGRLSAADMNALIAGGRDPRDIAAALISGKGNPPRSAMTLDALNALESRLVPQGPMSAADRTAYLAQIDALHAMQTGMPATAWSGQVPNGTPGVNGAQNSRVGRTGNTALDLANELVNSPTYSPAEQALLNQIQDPQQRAMQQLQMAMQKQSLLATMLTNMANMRHEMLKAVANNLRA